MATPIDRTIPRTRCRAGLGALLAATLCGCGGEPTPREVQNARAFEALLTAVSLKHEKEVEKDAKLIDQRHAAGEISEEKYRELGEILDKARAKDWAGAEKRAYEFRSQCGDRGSFFK
ncbi:MAG TPA: hypothetical protein VFF52_07360 [Isosphaeraceae bacterium]|nr:hypothetical protein [Isosphaeraceae bacterium]